MKPLIPACREMLEAYPKMQREDIPAALREVKHEDIGRDP
jgi:uncharacterized protein (DUF433 family)